MSELLPCPFCGGEPIMSSGISNDDGEWFWVQHTCNYVTCSTTSYDTEAEAVAAWNTRAAYEMDGWFYLPKPKQQLFNYTTGFSFDDLSMKATGTVDVYAITSAVQKWMEEALNAQIIERICEVFKPERTCGLIDFIEHVTMDEPDIAELSCGHDCMVFGEESIPNYCPNCGAKVVEQ